MKNILFSILMMISSGINSQDISWYDLDSGKRPKGNLSSYRSEDGMLFRKGDIIQIGKPSSRRSFSYITHGNALSSNPDAHLYRKATGLPAKISRIKVVRNKKGSYIQITCSTSLNPFIRIRFEKAIHAGEILLPNIHLKNSAMNFSDE